MKTKWLNVAALSSAVLMLQGCIAFPPLVQVERREGPPPPPPNQEVMKRLDTIDQRLKHLEKEVEQEKREQESPQK